MGYADVSLLGQLVEVMAGNVGMNREQFGDVSAGHRLGRLPHGQVDPATGRVAQRRGEVPMLRSRVRSGRSRNRLISTRNYSDGPFQRPLSA